MVSDHATLHIIGVGSDVFIPGTLIRTSLFTEPLVPRGLSLMDGASVS
jgi:hypothetical protein